MTILAAARRKPGFGAAAVARWCRMHAPRWFRLLPLALVAVLAALAVGESGAHAQVFKPRGKATAGRTTAAPAAARKPAAASATPSKKPTRATGATPRKVSPAPPKKGRTKARAKDDDVKIEDDDDDVKITDDE